MLVPGNLRLRSAGLDCLPVFLQFLKLLFVDDRPPGIDSASERDHSLKLLTAIRRGLQRTRLGNDDLSQGDDLCLLRGHLLPE